MAVKEDTPKKRVWNDSDTVCFNCGKTGHRIARCLVTKCGRCGQDFLTVALRAKHTREGCFKDLIAGKSVSVSMPTKKAKISDVTSGEYKPAPKHKWSTERIAEMNARAAERLKNPPKTAWVAEKIGQMRVSSTDMIPSSVDSGMSGSDSDIGEVHRVDAIEVHADTTLRPISQIEEICIDSGASTSVMSERDALRLALPIFDAGEESRLTLLLPDGTRLTSDKLAKWEDLWVSIAPVREPLLSVADLVDLSNTIHFDSEGSWIHNKFSGEVSDIYQHETDRYWYLAARDLVRCMPRRIPKTDEQRWKEMWDRAYPGAFKALSLKVKRPKGVSAVLTHRVNTIRSRVISLHERMGHVPLERMVLNMNGENPSWINVGTTIEQVKRVMRDYTCVAYALAKTKRKSLPQHIHERHERLKIGEIISVDPVGKINPTSPYGEYFFLFKDVKTGYLSAVITDRKDNYLIALEIVLKFYRSHGKTVKIIRSDSEKVLMSRDVIDFFAENSLLSENSVPYCHYQNSVERSVQTVNRITSALLNGQDFLGRDRWDLALKHAIDCLNHGVNSLDKTRSPYQRLTGKPTDLSRTFLFAFGEVVAVHKPDVEQGNRFDLKREIGIWVGQPNGYVDGSLVYWPATNKVSVRNDLIRVDISEEQLLRHLRRKVTLNEMIPPMNILKDYAYSFAKDDEGETSLTEETTLKERLFDMEDEIAKEERSPTTILRRPRQKYRPELDPLMPEVNTRRLRSSYNTDSESNEENMLQPSEGATKGSTMREGDNREPSVEPLTPERIGGLRAIRVRTKDEPTVRNALNSPERDQWITSMKKEVDQMFIERDVLIPTEFSRMGQRPEGEYDLIGTTMQLKLKRTADGNVDKFKARLCALGNQFPDGRTIPTYSPTIDNMVYMATLQIAITDRMIRRGADTVGAYLYQKYEGKPLYVYLDRNMAEAIGLDPYKLYRVNRYIYGLPESGLQYYIAYSEWLMAERYERSMSDPCLFIKAYEGERTYIWIHVDDTFIVSTSQEEIDIFFELLNARWKVTWDEDISSYLGINFENLGPNRGVRLTQPKLLKSIFEEFGERAAKYHATAPMRVKKANETNSHRVNATDYLHLLGMLTYLLKSRPDMSLAISWAASKSQSPTESDYEDLIYMVSWLQKTNDLGLILMPGEANAPLTLTCYVDESYQLYDDSKSQTGYTVSFGNLTGCFAARSSKQSTVATSSMHAETIAAFTLVKTIVFLYNLCIELHRPFELPAIILEDNQALRKVAGSGFGPTKRARHFLMMVNYLREMVMKGVIAWREIPAHLNIADILTKVVVGQDFIYKSQGMLGVLPEEERLKPAISKRKSDRRIRSTSHVALDKTLKKRVRFSEDTKFKKRRFNLENPSG